MVTNDNSGTQPEKNSALYKKVYFSKELEAVVGLSPQPRTEINKQLWKYIKAQGCQDEQNRRMINPDEKLAAVLGSTQPIDMFKMSALVAKHIKPTI